MFIADKYENTNSKNRKSIKIFKILTLAGVAQWIECRPENQRATGSILSQGICLGCRPDPQLEGYARGDCTLIFLSLSFSLPSRLSKDKYNLLKKIKNFLKRGIMVMLKKITLKNKK